MVRIMRGELETAVEVASVEGYYEASELARRLNQADERNFFVEGAFVMSDKDFYKGIYFADVDQGLQACDILEELTGVCHIAETDGY